MAYYLIQITSAWSLFALLYATMLRKETFFALNRAFLIGTALLGALLPLFPLGLSGRPGAVLDAVFLPEVQAGFQQAEQSVAALPETWSGVLWGFYLLGLALLTARMLWGFYRIFRLIVPGTHERLSDGCVLVRSDAVGLPVSFFHWIMIPSDLSTEADEAETQAMLAHERAHVQARHSADVMLMELLCLLFWFHPLAHWYRRALRTVHEYEADAAAVQSADRKQYGLLLLKQAHAGIQPALVHHFFQSPLKQRLLMLTRRASPFSRRWKYTLLAPLILFLTAATRMNAPETPANAAEVERLPEFPGGQAALMQYLATQIRYPESARADKTSGLVVVQFVVEQDGALSSIGVLKTVRGDLDEEAIRVLKAMPQWSPGLSQGKPVRTRMTLPIRFKLE